MFKGQFAPFQSDRSTFQCYDSLDLCLNTSVQKHAAGHRKNIIHTEALVQQILLGAYTGNILYNYDTKPVRLSIKLPISS